MNEIQNAEHRDIMSRYTVTSFGFLTNSKCRIVLQDSGIHLWIESEVVFLKN